MYRIWRILGLCVCFFGAVGADGQPSVPAASVFEGAKLGKVPEVLYAQVPSLPGGKGILVLEVAPGSSASKIGLKQYDVLLSLDGKVLNPADKLDAAVSGSVRTVPLVLLRGGREITLRIGPARVPTESTGPKAILKPGGPPTVAVEARALPGDRLTVTFTYFATGSSKLERVNCSGSVDEIKKRVKDLGQQKRMPRPVQDLAEITLERLRLLNTLSRKE